MMMHQFRQHLPKKLNSELSHKSDLYNVLNEIRESIHRNGKYSSRNQALDELTKLLFAHVMSISNNGIGIGDIEAPHLAISLKEFVERQYDLHLPDNLRGQIGDRATQLELRDDENEFASDIIVSFKPLGDVEMVKKFQGFEGVDILNETFGAFLTSAFSNEKEFGQYLTPHSVVNLMASMALDALPDDLLDNLTRMTNDVQALKILDPSCGTGSFLTECTRSLYSALKKSKGDALATSWLQSSFKHNIIGVDKSERMIRLALTNFSMFGAEHAKLFSQNGLKDIPNNCENKNGVKGQVALILTNPPFGAFVDIDDHQLSFDLPIQKRGRPPRIASELAFLERYVEWLCPGGIVATVVPDSVLYNQGPYKKLRMYLAEHVDLLACVSLPSVTFAAAGTSTKTSILLMQKKNSFIREKPTAYFGVCSNIGFKVSSRGAHRKTHIHGSSDLPQIFKEWRKTTEPALGRWTQINLKEERWDAQFQAGITDEFHGHLNNPNLTCVSDLAELITDKTNPKKWDRSNFSYIEISDVVASTNSVSAKLVPCEEAPSRARKIVRAGDVLVSTVRPERRTIGIVPDYLDGAVCTTGFAVLRPKSISPLLLSKLLQTDFANAQLRRNNVGISYPVFPESCLSGVILPIAVEDITSLSKEAESITSIHNELRRKQVSLEKRLKEMELV